MLQQKIRDTTCLSVFRLCREHEESIFPQYVNLIYWNKYESLKTVISMANVTSQANQLAVTH